MSDQPQPTPGPWRVIPSQSFDGRAHVVIAEGDGEYVVADRYGFKREQMAANLRLIAAAAAMLGVLDSLHDLAEGWRDVVAEQVNIADDFDRGYRSATLQCARGLLKEVEASIAKATSAAHVESEAA
jgi:hypothetical protein